MRPIQLTMQSFGSYKSKTVVRFDESIQNLFLITGDTGSGKSTIFDAISFALYDKVSSEKNNKDNRSLKSQYADPAEVPFVELVFTNNGKEYKIHRTPTYDKIITRGKNKGNAATVQSTVELTMPDGTPYLGKKTEVDKKIREIVGLSKEQFVKVAMIAQGEFLNFILEKSEDKKNSFRTLFKTEIYQNVIYKLKDMTASLAKDKKSQEDKISVIASMVKMPTDTEIAEVTAERLSTVLSGNMAEIEPFTEDLSALCNRLKTQNESLLERVRLAQQVRDAKAQLRTEANELTQHYTTLESAQKDLQVCAEQAEAIAQNQQLITEIRNAYAIQNKYQAYLSIQKKRESNTLTLRNCQNQLPVVKEKAKHTADLLKEMDTVYNTEYEHYIQLRNEVERSRKLFSEIAENEASLKHCEKQIAHCIQQKSICEKELSDCLEAEQKNIAEQTALQGSEVKLAELNARRQSLDSLSKNLLSFEQKSNAFHTLEAIAKTAEQKYQLAKEKLHIKQQKVSAMREAFYDNQAGILAQQLQDNKPCPVCGSTCHPMPCQPKSLTEEITKAQLDYADQQLSKLNEEFVSASQNAGDKKAQATTAKQSCLELFGDLRTTAITVIEGIDSGDNLQKIKAKTTQTVTENQQQIQLCTRQVQQYKVCSERLEALAKQKEAISKEIKTAEEMLQSAQLEKKRFETNLLNQKKDLRFASQQEADKKLREESEKVQQLDVQKAKTESELKANQNHIIQLEENIRHGEQTEKETAVESEQLFNDYTALMTDRQMTVGQWQTVAEQYRESDTETLQANINHYTHKKTAAQAVQSAMLEAIHQRPRPDLTEIQNQVAQAESALMTVRNQQSEIAELYRINHQAYTQLHSILNGYIDTAKKYQRVERLYRTFQKGGNKMKVDLETYAQRYFLKQILMDANRRFLSMSSGEYEIRLVNLDERLSSQSNQGLDLMVYSHTTDTERDIKTLSGGESFMAALSLALGMSDRIKASIPLLDLDMMFIDEGFGSLDDTSRQQAVRVLQNMAEGNKMIGIISHVTELKQQIDDQLLITKDDNGSHIQWRH